MRPIAGVANPWTSATVRASALLGLVAMCLVWAPARLRADELAAPAELAAPTAERVTEVLRTIDDRQRNSGDYKSKAFIESKERGKADVIYESVIYRRDADDNMLILFLNPKTERGKGYLRIDKNLWLYDPTVGKWERRTERERIAGTDSRRGDFDESRLADEFDAQFTGYEKLGKFQVMKLELKAKSGVDVAYPIVHLWVDTDSLNVLKRQDFALSGKLMRTGYYPKWQKVFSKSKGAEVWYPLEMRFFDEIEKENKTTVVIKSVDLDNLPANIFTKAWLEGQSR